MPKIPTPYSRVRRRAGRPRVTQQVPSPTIRLVRIDESDNAIVQANQQPRAVTPLAETNDRPSIFDSLMPILVPLIPPPPPNSPTENNRANTPITENSDALPRLEERQEQQQQQQNDEPNNENPTANNSPFQHPITNVEDLCYRFSRELEAIRNRFQEDCRELQYHFFIAAEGLQTAIFGPPRNDQEQ